MDGKRTDLALEVRESFEEDVEVKGVVLSEDYDKDYEIKVTTVIIKDEHGSKMMRKPKGTYVTIEAPRLDRGEKEYHKAVAEKVKTYVEQMVGDIRGKSILVAGLGNRQVTPDALGPKVVNELWVTRHLIEEFGKEFQEQNQLEKISAISPGVMAQTGMESGEIIKGIVDNIHPDIVFIVDALAARSIKRLNTTIQLTDTGISPGSGVGNHRKALNEENLGAKVIAIGVPTVVDAQTIVEDSLESILHSEMEMDENEMEGVLQKLRNYEMEQFFVTPKNIDEAVDNIACLIAKALNQSFVGYNCDIFE